MISASSRTGEELSPRPARNQQPKHKEVIAYMLIALDYDGTYTADTELWKIFITAAQDRGHEVIVATMRYAEGPEADEVIKELGDLCTIHFTGRAAKVPALKAMGIEPTIWIDDNPFWLLFPSG
jgi:hypothetical protein